MTNIDLTQRILQLLGKPESLIRRVADRPGHDRRYSLDTTKLQSLGWTPRVAFEQGLAETVGWYQAERVVVAADQGAATRPSRRTTSKQYGRTAGLTPAVTGFPSSPAPPASRAAICSTSCSRDHGAVAAWANPAGTPPQSSRRARALAARRPARSRRRRAGHRAAEAVGHLSLRRRRARRRFVGRSGRGRCRSTRSAPITCSKPSVSPDLHVSGARDRLGAGLSALADALDEDSPIGPPIPTASASWRRRWWPRATPGRRCSSPRPFNHAGPRQSPAVCHIELCPADRRDRGRPDGPGAARRQSRRAPRPHRCARYRPRLPAAGRQRPAARGPTTSAAGSALPRRRSARRRCSGLSRTAHQTSPSIPTRLRPADNPLVLGDPSRIAAEAGWQAAIPIERHASRPARLLATARRRTADADGRAFRTPKTPANSFTSRFGACACLLRYLPWWQAAACWRSRPSLFNLFVAAASWRAALYRPAERARRFSPASSFYPLAVLLLDRRLPAPARHRRGGLGHPRRRRRHGERRRPSRSGAGACRGTGRSPSRAPSRSSCSAAPRRRRACVVVPAGRRRSQPAMWFSLGAPFARGARAGARRNDPHPARRQPLGAGRPRRRSCGGCRSSTPDGVDAHRGSGGGVAIPAAPWRQCRRRRAGLPGADRHARRRDLPAPRSAPSSPSAPGWRGMGCCSSPTFLAAALSSRLGLDRKTLLGIAEERGGRRGAGNAIANTGFAAIAALLAVLTYAHDAGAARVRRRARGRRQRYGGERDRQGVGHAHVSRHTLRRCAPGTSGAMSLEGHAGRPRAAAVLRRSRARAVGLIDPVAAPAAAVVDRRDARRVGRERARRHARSAGHREQRRPQLPQHRHRRGRGASPSGERVAVTPPSRAALWFEFSRPFTLVAPALGFASGAVTAAGARADGTVERGPALYPAHRPDDGGGAQRGVERAQPDLRPRDRPRQQAEAAAAIGTAVARRARGRSRSSPTPSRWCSRGSSHRAAGTSVSGSSWSPRAITVLYSVPPFRTKRLGIWANVTIAIPARRAAEGCGLVGGQDDLRRRAVVHRRHLRPVPARRIDDQGLRRHGGRRARGMPDAADHLRRPPRRVDDLAVVRPARSC